MYMLFLGLTFLAYLSTVSLCSVNERLLSAITSHKLYRVKRVLMKYRDPIALERDLNTPDELGQTPLARAVTHGHPGIVRRLLISGANPCIPSLWGNIYPLSAAAFDGNLPIVQYLYEAGANPHACDTSGANVLAHAAYGSGRGIISYLLKMVGVNPAQRDNEQWSPLMHAVYSGQTEALLELLENEQNTFQEDYPRLRAIAKVRNPSLIPFLDRLAEHYGMRIDLESVIVFDNNPSSSML